MKIRKSLKLNRQTIRTLADLDEVRGGDASSSCPICEPLRRPANFPDPGQ